MKKRILTVLAILLIITSGPSFVSANNITNESAVFEASGGEGEKICEEENKSRVGENVTSLNGGYYNVEFDDGYRGFCVNHGLHSTNRGEKFTVKDTSTITSNIYEGESVGNYLKILFTEFHNHTMHPDTDIAQAVWAFTDGKYKDSEDPVVRKIIEMHNSGLSVNDSGEIRKINSTTEALFDFEALDSHSQSTQNFFGYKITYRDILEIIENSTITEIEKNDTEPNQVPEIQKNDTEPNQVPDENRTAETKNIIQPKITNESESGMTVQKHVKSSEAKSELIKHATGNPVFALMALLLFAGCVFKIRRD